MKEKVIIIGSGFGGLGAAARLAAQGYEVEIFEKLDQPGGRAYVFEMDGFKFDAGPTVITAPFMFDDILNWPGVSGKITCNLWPAIRFTASLTTTAVPSTTITTKPSF